MVKPKKPEIGVWKTVEAKGRRKHQKKKPKPILVELSTKSKKQNNDASRSKTSKQAKSVPKQKFYDRNRQLSNPQMSMPFPSYGSSLHVPWEFCFNMHYSYPPCSYNSYMSFPPRFFVQIILHTRNRQLKSHHLPAMTVLITKVGLCRKKYIR